jgi:hypothetical protein
MSANSEKSVVRFELVLTVVASRDEGNGTRRASSESTTMEVDRSDLAHSTKLGKAIAKAFSKLEQKAKR